MKKLADISSFESLQPQFGSTHSDIAVFNDEQEAVGFLNNRDDIVSILRKHVKQISDAGKYVDIEPRDEEMLMYAADELCEYIESGYPVDAHDLTKVLRDRLDKEVSDMLQVTGWFTDSWDWNERFRVWGVDGASGGVS